MLDKRFAANIRHPLGADRLGDSGAQMINLAFVMLQQGFINEVELLFNRGDLHADLPSLRAVGYRQAWDYLAGQLTYAEMQERAIIATRQLAKRQMTWLRSWQDLHWIESEDPSRRDKILKLIAALIPR